MPEFSKPVAEPGQQAIEPVQEWLQLAVVPVVAALSLEPAQGQVMKALQTALELQVVEELSAQVQASKAPQALPGPFALGSGSVQQMEPAWRASPVEPHQLERLVQAAVARQLDPAMSAGRLEPERAGLGQRQPGKPEPAPPESRKEQLPAEAKESVHLASARQAVVWPSHRVAAPLHRGPLLLSPSRLVFPTDTGQHSFAVPQASPRRHVCRHFWRRNTDICFPPDEAPLQWMPFPDCRSVSAATPCACTY